MICNFNFMAGVWIAWSSGWHGCHCLHPYFLLMSVIPWHPFNNGWHWLCKMPVACISVNCPFQRANVDKWLLSVRHLSTLLTFGNVFFSPVCNWFGLFVFVTLFINCYWGAINLCWPPFNLFSFKCHHTSAVMFDGTKSQTFRLTHGEIALLFTYAAAQWVKAEDKSNLQDTDHGWSV